MICVMKVLVFTIIVCDLRCIFWFGLVWCEFSKQFCSNRIVGGKKILFLIGKLYEDFA